MHFNIIGSGLSGLSAAINLQKHGHSFTILETDKNPGGRVKSDHIDGFILDHGFQIFLPTYAEAKAIMDYDKLDLQAFDPGALVLLDDGTTSVVKDPLREPSSLFSTLKSPVGSFNDKFKLLSLKSTAKSASSDISFSSIEHPTSKFLADAGFSDQMINNFFKPFFSGVFFENELETSSEMFKYLYNKFSTSNASIPMKGMGELVINLIEQLPPDTIVLNEKAESISKGDVFCSSGKNYKADKCIIAIEPNLLLDKLSFKHNKKKRYACTYYYTSDEAPFEEALISINASKNKAFNNIAVLSNISKAYAPEGQNLIAISTNFSEGSFSQDDVIKQCKNWFGTKVSGWKFLTRYAIPYALPSQKTVRGSYDLSDCKINNYQYVCGDHMLYGSINAAIKSGRLTTDLALTDV